MGVGGCRESRCQPDASSFQNKWGPLVATRPHGSCFPSLCPRLWLRQVPAGRGTKDSGPGPAGYLSCPKVKIILARLPESKWCSKALPCFFPSDKLVEAETRPFCKVSPCSDRAPGPGRGWGMLSRQADCGDLAHTACLRLKQIGQVVHIPILENLLCHSPGLGSWGVWAETKQLRKTRLWLCGALTLVSVFIPDRGYLGNGAASGGSTGPSNYMQNRGS